MHLVWAEIRLILTRMLWSFDFELANKSIEWEKQNVLVLIERESLMVRLSEQKNQGERTSQMDKRSMC